jgi:hypothetical protein
MKTANLVISALLILFGGFYVYLITELPNRNLPNTLGVAFMPWLLVVCLFVLSVLLFLNTIFNQSRETFDPKISLKEGTGILFLTFFIFIYVKAMNLFGFILITPVFLAILMLMTGSRKWKEIVIISTVAPVCIYFFFQKIFKVILPGSIFF